MTGSGRKEAGTVKETMSCEAGSESRGALAGRQLCADKMRPVREEVHHALRTPGISVQRIQIQQREALLLPMVMHESLGAGAPEEGEHLSGLFNMRRAE